MRSMEQEVLRMFDKNYYDVTNWDTGNPYEDIGAVSYTHLQVRYGFIFRNPVPIRW